MITPLAPTGEELIFYNYKEPLEPIKNGFGYMGVVLSNKEETRIQCHICGKLFEEVGTHARQAHKIKVKEYKQKFGLSFNTSLISESIRTARKIRTLKWLATMSPKERAHQRERARQGIIEWHRKQRLKHGAKYPDFKLSLEVKNKRGTCPDQLLYKIKVVAEKLGHSPSLSEFVDYYQSQRFLATIIKTFGSWINAKKMAGHGEPLPLGNPKGFKKPKYHDEELLEYLQMFYKENKKIPTETDARRGLIPSSSLYKRRFGGLPAARELAGIHEKVGRWVKKN